MRIQSRPTLSSNSTIGSTARLTTLATNQSSDMVRPQDRPPDVFVCHQDGPPDDPVRPQDIPPDRSTNLDRQTDSDETHLKFVDDEILMLRTKPDNELPEHVNVLFLKTLEDVDLNPETQEGLKQLLSDHRDTFATSSLDLGFCPLVQHDIDTGDVRPIRQSPRIPPMSAREAEDEILDEMLSSGVIEPSTSSWASPVCLVKKKDASASTTGASMPCQRRMRTRSRIYRTHSIT